MMDFSSQKVAGLSCAHFTHTYPHCINSVFAANRAKTSVMLAGLAIHAYVGMWIIKYRDFYVDLWEIVLFCVDKCQKRDKNN